MALTKGQKQKIIEDLKEKIKQQKIMIFVDFTGLKAKEMMSLRRQLRNSGNELKVAKKTLMGIAFKEMKIEFEPEKLLGETALVFGFQDEISPTKLVFQFSREAPNLKILGGFLENRFMKAEEIITLAQLPTREELLAKLTRNISTPISNFINVLEANIKGLLQVLAKAKT